MNEMAPSAKKVHFEGEELATSKGSSSEAHEVLTEFTFFPKLPLELQMKIFKLAIPPSRLVRVNVRGTTRSIKFSTYTPVPGLLRACKTSRETILKVYTTCIESDGKKIRMDGDNDVLVLFSTLPGSDELVRHGAFPWFKRQTMHPSHVAMFSGVKTLAIPSCTFTDGPPPNSLYWTTQRWLTSQFRSLERYLLVGSACVSPPNLGKKEKEYYFVLPTKYQAKFHQETTPDWAPKRDTTTDQALGTVDEVYEFILPQMRHQIPNVVATIVWAYADGSDSSRLKRLGI